MLRFLRYFLAALACWLTGAQLGQAQVVQWLRHTRNLSATYSATNSCSAVDGAGNSFVALSFGDSIRVGNRVFRPGAQRATVLFKYNRNGALQWVQYLRNGSLDRMAPDAAGGVYLVGYTPSSVATSDWNGTPIGSSGNNFFARCAANGSLRWAQSLPATSVSLRLTADDLGKAYLCGVPRSSLTLAGVPFISTEAFVAQSDSTGTFQWARQLHGDGSSDTYSFCGPSGVLNIGIGPKRGGGCLVFGMFHENLYFGAGTSGPALNQPNGAIDAFLGNFDAAGSFQWAQVVPSAVSDGEIRAATTDAAGNCYVTGGHAPVVLNGTTSQEGMFVAKFSATGSPLWLKSREPNTTGSVYSNGAGLALSVDPITQGVSVLFYNEAHMGSFTYGTLSMPSLWGVLHYNAQGQEQWLFDEHWRGPVPIGGGSFNQAYQLTALGYNAQGELFTVGDVFGSLRPRSVITLGSYTVVGDGAIVAKLNAQLNTLQGRVYFDQNANGQQDGSEGAFPRTVTARVVQGTDTSYYSTEASGHLQMPVATGSYALTLGNVSPNYTISQPGPGNYTGSFTGVGQLATGKVFGLAPLANRPDVRVTLTPYGNVRPGFLTKYRLTLENVGTTTVSGTVSATLDSRVQYVGSTPAATLSGGTLSWNYATLAPFGRLSFDVQFSLPLNVALGAVLTSTATAPLTGDVQPTDNSTTTPQTVTGSFDPNDISVNYSQLTPQQLSERQPLDYTIRFQNMGTDTAFTVVLQDTLSRGRLQLGTLQLIAQSHNCTWMISPNGLLTVRLINAQLPPRLTNTIASQGFVRFRVLPMTSLQPGAIIPNHAHIFFDYNSPVRTNQVTTTVLLPTAARTGQRLLHWDAYPNPTTDALTLTAELPTAGPVRIELLDQLGRAVRTQQLQAPAGALRQTLDLRTLPAGVYVLRLHTPDGRSGSQAVLRQ